MIGHELVFPQSNQDLYDCTYKIEVLKKKQFKNKKYRADIDLQDIPVVLKDVVAIEYRGNYYFYTKFYLIVSLNGQDVVVSAMDCYDKTELDTLNARYQGVFLYSKSGSSLHAFTGITYDTTKHHYLLTTDSDEPTKIWPSKPTEHYGLYLHSEVQAKLEYGVVKQNTIPRVSGNLIRY